MTVTINLLWIIYPILGWILLGMISIPVVYGIFKLTKQKMGWSEIFRTIIFGPMGLIAGIIEYTNRIINFIFGKRVWSVESKEGKIPFPYKDITSTIVSSYKLNHATDVIKTRKKIIYQSQFAETHPSYFKLIYKKKRIK